MKWSWRVGRLAGIEIRVHATFPLLFVWIALVALRGGATATAVLGTLGLLLAVFGLVVLHEYAHALVARHFGVRTHDITLLPIGGIARLDRMPREPKQELLIALAGPAVNVVLALVLWVIILQSGTLALLSELASGVAPLSWRSALAQLFAINVSLAVFNLLPAFPLDGGRALRALLAMRRHDFASATVTATRVGRVFALLFGLVGLLVLNNPMLVIIALFVWLSSASEAAAVQTTAALAEVPLGTLVITDIRTLTPDEPLSRAVELTLAGFQQDFPVVDSGTLVGMLTRKDLMLGLAKHGRTAPVRAAMQAEFSRASPDDSTAAAVQALATSGGAMPVVRGRTLIGLLTAENVGEFLAFRVASARAPAG